MERTNEQLTIKGGSDVVGSDGDTVGKVVAVENNYVVVEKGFFFPSDYYIPFSAIANYDEDKIYLNVTKEEALNQDPPWDRAPDTLTTTETTGYAADTTADYASGATRGAATASSGMQLDEAPFDHMEDSARTHVDETDSLRVPIHEEELTATTRQVEQGEVRIDKNVVSEERTIDVPVREERVRVERHAVNREATPGEDAFDDGSISIPLRGEEVELQKRTRVVEEVDIDKEAVEHTEQVGGTVRREQVRVDDSRTGSAQTTDSAQNSSRRGQNKKKRR